MESDLPEVRFEGCGEVIRQFRLGAGVSLRALSARLGCGTGQLSKIENNALTLSHTMLEKIAGALSIPSSAVLLGCLERRFPHLRDTPAGKLVSDFLTYDSTSSGS